MIEMRWVKVKPVDVSAYRDVTVCDVFGEWMILQMRQKVTPTDRQLQAVGAWVTPDPQWSPWANVPVADE